MRIPFRLLDVFTGRPFAGNQLCVVPDPLHIPAARMQAIAREIGFSETTFVGEAAGDRYAMRIFTPGSEIPFAGHPSLGTAYALVAEGRVTSPATQRTAAGESRMEVDLDRGIARMRQPDVEFGSPIGDREAVAAAVGVEPRDLRADLPVMVATTGLPHVMIPLASDEAVLRARSLAGPLEPLLRSAGVDGVYVFHADGDRVHARMFAPPTIPEDPATGSAAGPLGAYLVHHGAAEPGRLTVSQGAEMGRPSTLHVDVERQGGRLAVFVAGGVVTIGRGEFDLPD